MGIFDAIKRKKIRERKTPDQLKLRRRFAEIDRDFQAKLDSAEALINRIVKDVRK